MSGVGGVVARKKLLQARKEAAPAQVTHGLTLDSIFRPQNVYCRAVVSSKVMLSCRVYLGGRELFVRHVLDHYGICIEHSVGVGQGTEPCFEVSDMVPEDV